MVETYMITKCRSCGSEKLIPILSLGEQYVTDFISSKEDLGVKAPLELVLCDGSQGGCGLLQLKHSAPPEAVWNDQYWYKSGISTTIRNDLNDIVKKALSKINLNSNDLVVDIGCNDGTLLGFYPENKNNLVGFEPSKNVAADAKSKGFNIINNFFNFDNFKDKFGDKKAKIITAISMFYDLDDPNKFMKDIVQCLSKDGLFIIQQNYLATMLKFNAFDNICHEHREYYSMGSLNNLLKKYNLEIFDAELNDINGGSIRTYIKFKDNFKLMQNTESQKRIQEIENLENEMELHTLKPYLDFANRIEKIKKDLMEFVTNEVNAGKRIYIYGASTRGNVSLQYFGLNPGLIIAAADKNPDKWGKFTIGSLIPIVSPEEFRKANPDYLLVMTWHFFHEIKAQEKEFYESGGKFIVPMPELRIV